MKKEKVTVITGSLIPKGGLQWIAELWIQSINNNFIKFQLLFIYVCSKHLNIALLKSVLPSSTNPSVYQNDQIQGFLTLVKLITEIKHEVALAQTGTYSWSFSFISIYFLIFILLFQNLWWCFACSWGQTSNCVSPDHSCLWGITNRRPVSSFISWRTTESVEYSLCCTCAFTGQFFQSSGKEDVFGHLECMQV